MTSPMLCTGRVQFGNNCVTWHAEDADYIVTTEWTLWNAWTMMGWYDDPEVFEVHFSSSDTKCRIVLLNLRRQFCCVALDPRALNTPVLLPCLADERLYQRIAALLPEHTAYEACEELSQSLPRLRQSFPVRLRGVTTKG